MDGCAMLCVIVYGCVWLCVGVCVFVWLCVGVCWCMWLCVCCCVLCMGCVVVCMCALLCMFVYRGMGCVVVCSMPCMMGMWCIQYMCMNRYIRILHNTSNNAFELSIKNTNIISKVLLNFYL